MHQCLTIYECYSSPINITTYIKPLSKATNMLLDDSPSLFPVDFLYKILKPVNQETRISIRIMVDQMLVNCIAIWWICLIFEGLPDMWNR